jgi:hypothetical protein
MSAQPNPVNKTPKPTVVGGRHLPPAPNLTGRAGACQILGIDKRELRRLEEKGILRPAVVQPNGVRWFDIDTVWRLAVERQKAGKMPRRRARRPSNRPEGVQPVTGAQTRKIAQWFAAGLSHAEIVLLSGKTHETIRYLYAQYITPSGARLRMTAPAPADTTLPDPSYFPELEPPMGASRPRRPARPEPRALALPPGAVPSGKALPLTPRPSPAPSSPAPRRSLTQVPESWFADPLAPLPDDDGL